MVFKPHAYAWEKEYRLKGPLWRGYSKVPLLVKKGRVLELGCGNGKTLVPLAKAGLEVWGVDVSPTSLKLAERVLDEHALVAQLVEADASKLPFANGFFDAGYAVHVFDHLSKTERAEAAKELHRVLKPGGRAWFESFALGDAREGRGIEVEEHTFRKGTNVWSHFFTSTEVKELFESAGFKVGEVQELSKSESYGATRLERRVIHARLKRAKARVI